MAFALKRRFYETLPAPLKTPFGLLPFGVMAGAAYRRTLRRGVALDRAPREDVLACQGRLLGDMLAFAAAHVPAYRELEDTVARLRPFEALKAFPPVSKADLAENLQRYLPRDFEKMPHYACATGGSSGNQLHFYVDDDSHAVEMAFMHRQWMRVGYTPRARKATFRGVPFPHLGAGEYWQANPIYHELQFSPFHLSESTMPAYIDKLFAFRPQFLHGYPSALILLAEYVLRNEIDFSPLSLRAVLLGSEPVYPGQHDTLERAFRCRAYSWYGHSERAVLAGECEQDRAYHAFPDYGVVEILTKDGRAAEAGERGEIVGTGLLNRSMPFIRYRTEDIARRCPPECACGRRWDRFDAVEGRKQEYVVGRTGARISPTALNMHSAVFDKVLRHQYHQSTPGVMELRMVVAEDFTEDDARALQAAFAEKVGDELGIELRVVEEIPLTQRGKLRRLIQEIPGEGGTAGDTDEGRPE